MSTVVWDCSGLDYPAVDHTVSDVRMSDHRFVRLFGVGRSYVGQSVREIIRCRTSLCRTTCSWAYSVLDVRMSDNRFMGLIGVGRLYIGKTVCRITRWWTSVHRATGLWDCSVSDFRVSDNRFVGLFRV